MRELLGQTDPLRNKPTYADIPEFASLLQSSPAFAQYLNWYSYFSVRFAAGRISNPCTDRTEPAPDDCNQPILGLPSPPLSPEWDSPVDSSRFIAETAVLEHFDPKVAEALRFLDDFVQYREGPPKGPEPGSEPPPVAPAMNRDERRDFELWLRGLYHAADGGRRERFSGLATGLLKWAENRCAFYLSLEEQGSRASWLPGWRKSGWREGSFHVTSPIAARCALVDFYWLSRILRADVNPRGVVSYRGHSWLWLIAMHRAPGAPQSPPRSVADLVSELQPSPRPVRAYLKTLLDAARSQDPVHDSTIDEVMLAFGRQPPPPGSDAASIENHELEHEHWRKLLLLMTHPADEAAEDAVLGALSGQRPLLWGPEHAELPAQGEVLRMEEILRAVFAYACDLVQNAVEKAERCQDNPAEPAEDQKDDQAPKRWRAVFDSEMEEIAAQRREWRSTSPAAPDTRPPNLTDIPGADEWSRRITTGDDVHNLIGLALSGGGIRSATFGLGVLQQLQQLDLLRNLDYLSTVSGGGYIGAWLIGNVRRTRYWLSRLTGWDKSIQHLRRYSNYLAPENGLLRADSWTMWGTWIRNAFLIQLTAFALLASCILTVFLMKAAFTWSSGEGEAAGHVVLGALMVVLCAILGFYQWQLSVPWRPPKQGSLEQFRRWALDQGDVFARRAAAIALAASFVTGGLLWGQAKAAPAKYQTYSGILSSAVQDWNYYIVSVFVLTLWLLGLCAVWQKSKQSTLARFGWSLIIAVASSATAYLTICAVLRLYGFLLLPHRFGDSDWLAFSFGPAGSLLAVSLAVTIFIGLVGRDSAEWNREWWTRYGSWIAMYGTVALLFVAAAVFAPLGTHWVFTWSAPKLAALHFGWVGSVIGGLLAGKSARTGSDKQAARLLEFAARLGGFLFIVGAIALSSTMIYVVLAEMNQHIPGPDFVNFTATLTRVTALAPADSRFLAALAACISLSVIFSNRFDLNTFGLNQFYRNRLVRCYLGATRWQPGKRHPHRFTDFDMKDDIELACLTVKNTQFCGESFRGPLPIVNCTLNLGGSSDLAVHTRQSDSFTLTPLFCGADRPLIGYIPTADYAGAVTLGQAISISGAAASPNMGYNTSPLVSFLLTMFNVRLGWWFPNPGTKAGRGSGTLGAFYLIRELFGTAGEKKSFINVSDGGHFENLGIYELIRRRMRVIIACDAECDEDMTFGSLGNVIRICETDFGARIEMDVSSIRRNAESGLSTAHCAVGRIVYSNGSIGYLIYLKSSVTGDEDVGVSQYRAGHPKFPHESTADQFFSEDQFEAYRRLGFHIAERAFRGAQNEPRDPYFIARKLADLWVPSAFSREAFLKHADAFDRVWDRFRGDPNLSALFCELTGDGTAAPPLTPPELTACMELLQLMENVFVDLRFDDFWEHPDNRGWAMLFTSWAQSPKFRDAWDKTRHTYGIRFEYFCHQHLGMERDRPVVRV